MKRHRGRGGDVRVTALLIDRQFADPARRAEPALERIHFHGNGFVWRDRASPRDGVVRARTPLRRQLPRTIQHVVEFEDGQMGPGAAHVVLDGGRSIEGGWIVGHLCVMQQFLLRTHRDAIERLERSLGRRIVPAHGLDNVADEFEANRLRFAGRIEVENAAAHAELAVFIDGVLR
jgi:hypothetical protein